MRVCTLCGLTKDPKTDFYVVKKRNASYSRCKDCHNKTMSAHVAANPEKQTARVRSWQQRNPDRDLQTRRRYKYKIDFAAMWEAQKGLCACCGKPMVRTGRAKDSVCVDHDRSCCPGQKSCGKCVRGLLHWSCNLVLGFARDDEQLLLQVAAYAARWKQTP